MDIVSKAELFVHQFFKDNLSPIYSYHNFEHTQRVVDAVKILSQNENVNIEDQEFLLLAAWFHDVGYCQSCLKHESIGSDFAEKFLLENGYNVNNIEKVKNLIKSTCLNHTPNNLLEFIIRDADSAHVGSEEFFEITDSLRRECKEISHVKISKLEWAKGNMDFLEKHHQFYTQFALINWQPTKELNIDKTKKMIEELTDEKENKVKLEEEKSLLNKKKLEKLNSPDRGIDTMFRVTLSNHMRLSQIADNKANILLSVNAIIISVALSTIVPKLDSPNNSHLIYPTFIMIVCSVATIITAIMSTRPKVSSGTFTRREIEDKKVNLLFFGNFYKMPLEEYMWAMKEMIKDKEYLYDTMIKDLYYLGVVLDRKYKLLRTTYTIFLVGLISSVLAFYIAFKSII